MVNRVAAEGQAPDFRGDHAMGRAAFAVPSRGGAPCYECVFPTRPAPGMVPTCAEAGVAAPLPGVIGSMMAMEAVKHITGAGETLQGR
jgi:molybdopterin/thiamine biosynthesis adenylyltransferase